MSQSPESDTSSIIDELSFEYIQGEDGQYIRVSKGKHRGTPPTPPLDSPLDNGLLKPTTTEPILIGSPGHRSASLSRSESAFSVLPRSFQRVASGPAAGAPRRVPRRTSEDPQPPKRITEQQLKAQLAASAPLYEEKENIRSSRLSLDVPSIEEMYGESPMPPTLAVPPPQQKQRLLTRGASLGNKLGKLLKASSTSAVESTDAYRDVPTDVEDEAPHYYSHGPQRVLQSSTSSRPRRSASLSDALSADEQNHHHYYQTHDPVQGYRDRPGTSLGVRLHESDQEPERRPPSRQSPSPTHGGASRPNHKRRDSDTLRNGYSVSSPTVREVHAVPAKMSPSAKGMAISVKHRRSPTAPEPSSSALSRTLPPAGEKRNSGELRPVPERERERPRERPRSTHQLAPSDEQLYHQQPQQPQQRQHQAQPPAQTAPQPSRQNAPPPPSGATSSSGGRGSDGNNVKDKSNILVNKKSYYRLDLLGKGGSSRVFRVISTSNELYALKRVALDKTDPETMAGYMNEISLLKRLSNNSRIIRLIDSEVRPGVGGSKGNLMLVMECGEIDLARLLNERAGEGVDMIWIAYYWQQMLQAVQVIHDEKIVHSDLKPANFVLVKGQLKLIDFGIANAIANDTTNIQRDHQIGTLNYMSPEAIEIPDGQHNRRLKVGRPSDVWSLGCILYQMVYGQAPFHHLSVYQKMKAIPDSTHIIDFPEYSAPSSALKSAIDYRKWKVRSDVLENMKSCLQRSPKARRTIPQLLEEDWLSMKEPEKPAPVVPSPAPAVPPPNITLKDLLKSNEAVIDPHYMVQLLMYGVKLGREGYSIDTEEQRSRLIPEGDRLVAELRSIHQ